MGIVNDVYAWRFLYDFLAFLLIIFNMLPVILLVSLRVNQVVSAALNSLADLERKVTHGVDVKGTSLSAIVRLLQAWLLVLIITPLACLATFVYKSYHPFISDLKAFPDYPLAPAMTRVLFYRWVDFGIGTTSSKSQSLMIMISLLFTLLLALLWCWKVIIWTLDALRRLGIHFRSEVNQINVQLLQY